MSNLNSTVSANRTHIGFFGLRNAGKSSVVSGENHSVGANAGAENSAPDDATDSRCRGARLASGG